MVQRGAGGNTQKTKTVVKVQIKHIKTKTMEMTWKRSIHQPVMVVLKFIIALIKAANRKARN